jgi:DNA-binding NtrC family response regulator
MAFENDFISATDKPALLGITDTELAVGAKMALAGMGYKVHSAETHEEFLQRFGQAQYQVVVLEENFGGVSADQNVALTTLQNMNMALRRHATVIVIGAAFQTLQPMQAFQQSAHAVVNSADSENFQGIFQQAIHSNEMFLNTFRDVQAGLAQTKR